MALLASSVDPVTLKNTTNTNTKNTKVFHQKEYFSRVKKIILEWKKKNTTSSIAVLSRYFDPLSCRKTQIKAAYNQQHSICLADLF